MYQDASILRMEYFIKGAAYFLPLTAYLLLPTSYIQYLEHNIQYLPVLANLINDDIPEYRWLKH